MRLVLSYLITGGIGDVFVLEACFPDRNDVGLIYYATPQAHQVQRYLEFCCPFAQHIVICDNRVFVSKAEVWEWMQQNNYISPPDWNKVQDWSILTQFPRIRSGKLKRGTSTACRQKLCDFSVGTSNICCIHPITQGRELDGWELQLINDYIVTAKLQGLVVEESRIDIPFDWVNLSGLTSLFQAVEVVKQANVFIGVDSCFSVIAAESIPSGNVIIKCNNQHGLKWQDIYWGTNSKEMLRGSLMKQA